jgi:hypothetical protein
VKIPAAEILYNIGEHVPKGQLIYIATDEKNRSFFDPLYGRFSKVGTVLYCTYLEVESIWQI